MLTPIYRLATVHDLAQLVELRILMQNEVNRPGTIGADDSYIRAAREYFLRGLDDGTYLSAVAEANGSLVSANGITVYRKPPSITGGTGLFGYVSNVYTRPEWRGQGIARELMRLAVNEARRRGVDRLQLNATDLGKSVYESVGFQSPRYTPLELKL